MEAEGYKPRNAVGGGDSSDVETWDGVPLELDIPHRGLPPGEETIERPIAELLPRPAPGVGSPWLARWLLFCALAALTFSATSIALSALSGSARVPWQGGLLALDGAVLLLVLRGYLVHGTPAHAVCHWVLGLAGLTASALVIQAALVRSAVRYIYGTPPPEVLTELFVFGLLGLAGSIIFVGCLRGGGWACRSAAAAAVAFLALVLFGVLSPRDALIAPGFLRGGLLGRIWPALVLAAAGSAGFALGWERYRGDGGRRWWLAVIAGGLLVLIAGAALAGRALRVAGGPALGAERSWSIAALWEAAALLPLGLPGVAIAWRRSGSLQKDLLEATQFLWILVALGVVAMVGVWLPTHLSVDLLRMGLVAAGVSALVTGAWLGAKRGNWAGRWVLIPTGGVTIAVLCTLGELQSFVVRASPAGSAVWSAAVTLSWCSLAIGLTFATAGLAVKRHRARTRFRDRPLWPDTNLLGVLGVAISALLLSLLFAGWAGDRSVATALQEGLRAAGNLAGDLLFIAGGSALRAVVAGGLAGLWDVCAGPVGLAGAAGVLAVLLVLHLAAISRARWAVHAMVGVWIVPLAALTGVAALYAVRLVVPIDYAAIATSAGRYIARNMAARLILLGLAAVLLVRLWESVRSALTLAAAPPAGPAGRGLPGMAPPSAPAERNLAFLVRAGLLAGSLGLVTAALLSRGATLEATFTQLGLIASDWLHAGAVLTDGVGRLSAEWVGYAAATAVVVIVLLAVHEEAVHGRVAVYPLVGLVWVVTLGVFGLGWALEFGATPLPAPAGRLPALVVMGLVLLLLLAATLTVWVRWWRLRGRTPPADDDLLDHSDAIGAAHSLGSIGLMLLLVGSVAVAHSALKTSPPFTRPFEALGALARGMLDGLALAVEEARTGLAMRQSLGVAGAGLALLSITVLAVHLLSRHRGGTVRILLFALWSGAAMVAGIVGGYLLLRVPIGQWSAGRLLAAIVLAGLIVRTVVAVCNLDAWSGLRAEGKGG